MLYKLHSNSNIHDIQGLLNNPVYHTDLKLIMSTLYSTPSTLTNIWSVHFFITQVCKVIGFVMQVPLLWTLWFAGLLYRTGLHLPSDRLPFFGYWLCSMFRTIWWQVPLCIVNNPLWPALASSLFTLSAGYSFMKSIKNS